MNSHPLAMFEIIASDPDLLKKFYGALFGWEYTPGSNGFEYIKYNESPPAHYSILGGIGKAQTDIPGFEAGVAFYLQVEEVTGTLSKVQELGGSVIVEKTEFDNYTIGMFKDPEGNLIGIIEHFLN